MDKNIFRLIFLTLSILVVCVSLPLVLNKVPPNGVYGFRTPQTLSNSVIWYQVNAYGARMLIEGALLTIIVAALLSISEKISNGVYMAVCMIVFMGGISLSAYLSIQYQTQLVAQLGSIPTGNTYGNQMPPPALMAFLYIVTNLTMIIVAVPMAQRRVAPNPWYGFRTKQTLSNPDVWYAANAYCGRSMITFASVNILLDIVLLLCVANPLLYMLTSSFCLFVGLLLTTASSMSYMKSLG